MFKEKDVQSHVSKLRTGSNRKRKQDLPYFNTVAKKKNKEMEIALRPWSSERQGLPSGWCLRNKVLLTTPSLKTAGKRGDGAGGRWQSSNFFRDNIQKDKVFTTQNSEIQQMTCIEWFLLGTIDSPQTQFRNYQLSPPPQIILSLSLYLLETLALISCLYYLMFLCSIFSLIPSPTMKSSLSAQGWRGSVRTRLPIPIKKLNAKFCILHNDEWNG